MMDLDPEDRFKSEVAGFLQSDCSQKMHDAIKRWRNLKLTEQKSSVSAVRFLTKLRRLKSLLHLKTR